MDASALLVVLSNASVNSDWCRREITAGLVRELEEKRVVILPVLVEACEIPLFLRDKKYADFRTNPDKGLHDVLEAIAQLVDPWMARIENPEFHTDFGLDWFPANDGTLVVRVMMVDHAEAFPFVASTEVVVRTNAATSQRFREAALRGEAESVIQEVMDAVDRAIDDGLDLTVLIPDNFPQHTAIELRGADTEGWVLSITARRLGTNTGADLVLHVGQQLSRLHEHIAEALGPTRRRRPG